jgi:hypothetical protein
VGTEPLNFWTPPAFRTAFKTCAAAHALKTERFAQAVFRRLPQAAGGLTNVAAAGEKPAQDLRKQVGWTECSITSKK